MNKEKAIQELDELENRAKELRRLICGSGFSWDFDPELHLVNIDAYLDYVDEFADCESGIKASKMCVWVCLLQHLADHFNPDGWEWKHGNKYNCVIFDTNYNELAYDYWTATEVMTPKFHPDVIDDVIKELNNHKSKWWHLVTDNPLEES